jgi:RHS repeat-associated protein
LRNRKASAAPRSSEFWDFENYLAETDDQNEIQAVYTNEPQQYGNLISQYRKDGAIWTPSYYKYDALGSTRALTDDGGDGTDTYIYDAWGNEVTASGTTVNPFRWVGRVGYYYDEKSGTFHIRARVYEPVVGWWMSQDPLFYPIADPLHEQNGKQESWDQYGYAAASPLIAGDPSGMLPGGLIGPVTPRGIIEEDERAWVEQANGFASCHS